MSVASSGAQYRCDGCGRDLSGVRLGVACACGVTARRRVDAIGAVYRRPPTPHAPPWDPFKDWSVKYLQFTWNVVQLRRLCAAGRAADPVEVRGIVEATFASCSGLAEWLVYNPEPASVTPGDVAQLIGAEPLCIGSALAAAAQPGAATSRIATGTLGGEPRFWIEYRRPGARATRYDALDLAEQCLTTWRGFLTQRGVALPSWDA